MIARKNVQSAFMLVCVEAYRTILPAFVKAVPTILTRDKYVLEGAAAYALVEMIHAHVDNNHHEPSNNTHVHPSNRMNETHLMTHQAACDVRSDGDVDAKLIDFPSHDQSGSWSDGYSFLDSTNAQPEANSVFSGITENTNISLRLEHGDDKRRSTTESLQNKKFDSYISNRENDTKLLRISQVGTGQRQ